MPVGLVSIFFVIPTKAQHFPKEFETKIAAYICVVRILHVVEILDNIYFPDERDERS